MGKSILEKIQAKLELLRLEKRYTRSRHRRSAFVSGAVYVDGEYVFQTPNSTGSSSNSDSGVTTPSGTPGIDALHGDLKSSLRHQPSISAIAEEDPVAEEKFQRKRLNRFSSMPAPAHRDEENDEEQFQRKKLNRFSSMPGFGGSYDVNKTLPRVQERRLSMIR